MFHLQLHFMSQSLQMQESPKKILGARLRALQFCRCIQNQEEIVNSAEAFTIPPWCTVDAVYNSHTRPKRLMIASVSRQLRRCASTEKIRLWHFRPNVMRIAKIELRVCFGRTSQGANRKKTSEHRIIDRLPKGILGAILIFFFEIVFL